MVKIQQTIYLKESELKELTSFQNQHKNISGEIQDAVTETLTEYYRN